MAASAQPERREGVVLRPALFARLEHASRITLLSAPAGSGKSYLLRSWIRANDHLADTAWVTVDHFDPAPESFWVAVFDALRGTRAGARDVHALTVAPDLDAWMLVERLLVAVARFDAPVWLVVDDLQELTSQEGMAQLELFVMRAPPTVRFVFATRREPPIPLHRVRVEGELTELRGDDLRFSLDEARALFDEAHVTLPEHALATLLDKTEGWAAGLRLGALCLMANPDPDTFLREFSGSERTVADYLTAEVLDRQPEPVRYLLLRTSILEFVSGPLADHLTGMTGGEAILQELDRANAFVMATDIQRTTFRYHPMFAELLQSCLRIEESADGIRALHRSAAQWYADHGMAVESVRCALAAEDWVLAKTFLLHNWFEHLSPDSQLGVISELLAAFPPTVAAQDAIVPSMEAVNGLVRGAVDTARRSLAIADATLQFVDPAERTRVDVVMAIARAGIARELGDTAAGVEEASNMLDATERVDWLQLGVGDAVRALALTTLGVTELWSDRPEEAEQHLDQAVAAARRSGRPYILVSALSHHAMVAMAHNPELAEERGREAVALADANGWSGQPIITMAHLALAASYAWRGHLDAAEHELAVACPVIRPEARPLDALLHRYLTGAVAFGRRRIEEAATAFDLARRMSGLVPVSHALLLKSHALWLHCLLQEGEVDRVAAELDKLDESARGVSEVRTVVAALALRRGDPSAALDALAPLTRGEMHPMLPDGWRSQPALFAAAAYDALGDAKGTSGALERALDIAEPHGEVLPFMFYGDVDLLSEHLRRGSSHAALLTQVLDCLTGAVKALEAEPPFTLRDPLTARETRVLRYLPTNLTTREIAEEMYVSVNTVKTHMRHLYEKLGVDRRGDAVERARTLGFLAPARNGT